MVLKSLTTKEMYLKAVQEMYPEADMCLLSSNLAIFEDLDNIRTVAALKAFTAVRKMITEKKLVYDNRTLFLMMKIPMEVVPVMCRKGQRKRI